MRNFYKFFEDPNAGWAEMFTQLHFVQRSVASAFNDSIPHNIDAALCETKLREMAGNEQHPLHKQVGQWGKGESFAFVTVSGCFFGRVRKAEGIRFQVTISDRKTIQKHAPSLIQNLLTSQWRERPERFALFLQNPLGRRLRGQAKARAATPQN